MSADKATVSRMTGKYRDLIFKFVDRQISAEEFESAYLRLFKHDKDQVFGPKFNTLEKLFFAVEMIMLQTPHYVKLFGGLDEEQLRDCARNTYHKIYPGIDH